MPRVSSVDGLPDLLDRQLTVASRQQLLALGMKDDAMQYRVRAGGPWQTLLPGVYLAASGVPSFSQKEMAALLYAGQDSLITGPAALAYYSIRSIPFGDLIDVLYPRADSGSAPASPGCTGRPGCQPESRRAGRCGWHRRLAPWPARPGCPTRCAMSAPWSPTLSSSAGARYGNSAMNSPADR